MGHAKTVNVWKCDHCGKEEPWGQNWRSRMILHKSGGPGPWDEELVACSEDCAKSIDEKRKAQAAINAGACLGLRAQPK